jgi:hypothetical protein
MLKRVSSQNETIISTFYKKIIKKKYVRWFVCPENLLLKALSGFLA